jgi:hypothetical protein
MTGPLFLYCLWTGAGPAWWWLEYAMHTGLRAC